MQSRKQQSTKITPISLLQKCKSADKLQNYEEKLTTSLQTNAKLKELFNTMRNNNIARKIQASQVSEVPSDDQQFARLKKKKAKLQSQIQHLTNNLNFLNSENGKLKAQVDSSRNSRVIYSNVYKTIQKEIRKHEYIYKLSIIDSLSYQEVESKVIEKLQKIIKKLEKDINELDGVIKPLTKKQKRKSRLDTGLSTYRINNQIGSNQQNHNQTQQCEKVTGRHMLKKDEILQTSEENKKDALTKRSSKEKHSTQCNHSCDPQQKQKQHVKMQKFVRSKACIPAEAVQDYYQLQMKSNYYDNLLKQLRQICEVQNNSKIGPILIQVDADIEKQFKQYLTIQEELKKLQEQKTMPVEVKTEDSSKQIILKKTTEQLQLQALQQECKLQKQKMWKNQQILTELMDLNCHKLNDEQIHHHILRIKRRGEATTRQLQKLLQNVTKDKNNGHNPTTSRVTSRVTSF